MECFSSSSSATPSAAKPRRLSVTLGHAAPNVYAILSQLQFPIPAPLRRTASSASLSKAKAKETTAATAAAVTTTGCDKRRKPLTIRDAGFFLSPVEAENGDGFDSDQNAELEPNTPVPVPESTDAPPMPASIGLRAPPPTPMDPFTTPPETPVRALTTLDGNSPERLWNRANVRERRVKQEMKIVQVLGAEAAEAAREHVFSATQV